MRGATGACNVKTSGGLKGELDAAFAAVQLAIEQHARGTSTASTLARDSVARTAAMLKLALREADRSEGEKRILVAKFRALIGAAGRIPGP